MKTRTALTQTELQSLKVKKLLKAFLLFTAWGLLSACNGGNTGSALTGTTNLSSVLPGDTPIGSAASECNHFAAADSPLAGNITTYYYNGSLQEDKIRLRITGLPAAFDTNSNYHIQLFRWKASKTTPVELDSVPLQFAIYHGTTALTSVKNSVSAADLASVRSAAGVNGTASVDVLGQTTLVVANVDYTWDVLKVVVYDGTTAISQKDVLIPIFAANPNIYAADHPAVLNQLHPFWDKKTQSSTEADWAKLAQPMCF
jgi:hypothetical protein